MEVIPLAVFGLCVQGLKNIWTTKSCRSTFSRAELLFSGTFWSRLVTTSAESTKIQLRTHAIILSVSPVIPSNNHHPVASAVKAASTTGMWNLARCTHHTSVSGYFRSFHTGNRPVWLNCHDDSSQCSQNKSRWQALRRSVWLYVVNLFCLCVAGDGHMVLRQALFPVPAGEHVQTHGHAEGHRGAGVHSVPGALRGWAAVTNTPAEISREHTGVTTRLMGLLFLQIKMFVYGSQV